MTIGAVKPFSTTVATATTYSTAIDLGGGYKNAMLGIPTMASATDIRMVCANTLTGTYRPVYLEPTAAASSVVLNIASTVTNCFVPINISAQFVKVEFTSATTSSSHVFDIICNSN